MPPKAVITKDKVLQASFQLVQEQGIEVLTARNVALKLKCSTQPIYSAFESMELLKDELFELATDYTLAYIRTHQNERNSKAMNLASGILLFANQEKPLFKFVFLTDHEDYYSKHHKEKKLEGELFQAFIQIDPRLQTLERSKLKIIFVKLSAYLLGIGSMITTSMSQLNISEAEEMIEEMYQSLLAKENII